MEMPEQKVPLVFSQMLQMFPNIPHNIVWIYVQRYSSDIEKCAQMLNLQNGKYTELNSSSALDNSKHLNEYNIFLQQPDMMPPSKPVFVNNNATHLTDQLFLSNDKVSDTIKEKATDNPQTEGSADSSQTLHSSGFVSCNTVPETVAPVDNSDNLSNSFNFNKPLTLQIDVHDNDDSLHSWRPNISADALCSDFFLASPMIENFLLNSSQISNLNSQCNIPKIQMNSENMKQQLVYSATPMHVFHTPQDERAYVIDLAGHLHYQKSQMNAIRYEVIKAKIELSDLKESGEKLQLELREKMQSKSVQDIEELNKEIVQLRLECQCLCSEVYTLNDQVLLGEVDERYYERKNLSNNHDIQNSASVHSTHSQNENSSGAQGESQRWQCSKCTFANHPDINACEMCQVKKPSSHSPLYVNAAASASCYCHPKEESLSFKS